LAWGDGAHTVIARSLRPAAAALALRTYTTSLCAEKKLRISNCKKCPSKFGINQLVGKTILYVQSEIKKP